MKNFMEVNNGCPIIIDCLGSELDIEFNFNKESEIKKTSDPELIYMGLQGQSIGLTIEQAMKVSDRLNELVEYIRNVRD